MFQECFPEEKTHLLQLIKGSEKAFSVIYSYHSPALFRKIFQVVKSTAVADELLQDVFVKIWQRKETIDLEKSFRAFLFKIAENKVYDYLRAASREKTFLQQVQRNGHDEQYHAENTLENKEIRVALHHAINSLPPQRKEVFKLCKLDGKSYKEVSGELSISTATISDHIVKANHHIRKYLTQTA